MAEIVAFTPTAQAIHILLVEDSTSDAVLIRKVLTKATPAGTQLQRVETLEAALSVLALQEFDVVLLDLSLPDSSGLDGLLSIQNLTPKMPVLILTAHGDEEMALKAVEQGAQDYMFKDHLDSMAIRRAMQYAMLRKQFESTLIHQANYDTLTGLANRTLFESRLGMALARSQRTGSSIGIFYLDLNRFKHVNDTLGHAAGDRLLTQVGERLRLCLRPYDTAARLGGDEFALLIEGMTQPRDCAVIAQKIIGQLTDPFIIDERKVEIGVSIGIATCEADEQSNAEALLRSADEAMYDAKCSLHSDYRFYTKALHEQTCTRLKLEDELAEALACGGLMLHYQPKIELATGRTIGAEALVRWNHPLRGVLFPAEFIAIAEETGLAGALGNWVLKTVCEDLARWQTAGLPTMQVSINLFPAQLDDAMLPSTLGDLLRHHALNPTLLAMEVPGSALLEKAAERIPNLQRIRALGIGLQLDHVGLSALSFDMLQLLAIDALKIAPEVIRSIHEPGGMLPLVQAIIDIAKRFNIGIIATGIENEWQQAFFRERHCNQGQGFALCRPLPSEFVPDWLINCQNNGLYSLKG